MQRLKDAFNLVTTRKGYAASLAITYGSFAPYMFSIGASPQHIAYFYSGLAAITAAGLYADKIEAPVKKIFNKFSKPSKEKQETYISELEKSALAAPDCLLGDFEKLKEKAGLANDCKLYLTTKYPETGATDGKNIYLGTKLIEKFPRDELNAIIAHEIAHIMSNDANYHSGLVLPMMIAMPGSIGIIPPALAAGYIQESVMTLAELSIIYASFCRFGHQKEYEADAFAAKLTNKNSLTRSFHRMKDERTPPSFKKILPSFLRTHPSWDKRIEAIEKMDDMQILDHATN